MSNIGNKETMAKNLRYYVERSGKTQKEICEIIGVATSTFNDWMKAKKYPRIDKIEMLASLFHILKSDLIEEKESPAIEDGISEKRQKLIDFAKTVPEDKVDLVLKLMRTILEDAQ